MMYIAEITSSAVRLDASWGLTHAAMSLLRDRYEQAVRFSWLVRNPDQGEFQKYERAIFSKMGSLARSVSAETRQRFAEKLGPLPAWAAEAPTKEQRVYLDEWSMLDLRSMAKKRDEFPPIAETALAKEKLATWYDSIYSQFSSVSHYDRYSIELLTLNPMRHGGLVLATPPHWPGLLMLQNAHFDIIQCFEAAQICHKRDVARTFEVFLAEWMGIANAIAQNVPDISRA
jgi:hypothetical protein